MDHEKGFRRNSKIRTSIKRLCRQLLHLERLSCKQKLLVALVIVVVCVVYFTSAPSASWLYDYTRADRIADTIVTAPPLLTSVDEGEVAFCPLIPNFEGIKPVRVDFYPDESTFKELVRKSSESDTSGPTNDASPVLSGGSWRPIGCQSRHRVALVVPYRDRPKQLEIFLNHMHRFLRKQYIDYRIIVVEQNDTHPFNRGTLLNIGFVEALKLRDFRCFIFHDVDLLPEVLANVYACSTSPRHMTVAINTMRYNLPYKGIFGGVTAMTGEQFRLVNGYSNYFFGWGGEDDDLSNRIADKGMKPMRWDPKISRYYMISHAKATPNPNRFDQLQRGRLHYGDNGLNNLTYKLIKLEELELYTLVSVQLEYHSQDAI